MSRLIDIDIFIDYMEKLHNGTIETTIDYSCGNCGKWIESTGGEYKYCPYCGKELEVEK